MNKQLQPQRVEVRSLICLSKPDTFVIAFISAQPPSSQKPNFKSYEEEKTVEPCALTEDSGQDDEILSGEVQIISKAQFVSKIAQTIPRLKKIQNYSKIPDYVHQRIAEAMSLLKMDLDRKGLAKRPNIHATKKTNKKHRTFEAAKDSGDQDDEMINVEVGHIDNQPRDTEIPPNSMKKSMMKPLPPLLEIFKPFKKGRQLNMIQWDKL
ncbi:hypothetical protein O181_095065 [Austropuccinia psidii MF-1]|uniref:Uncharacterized protein n=1 Tax=Austropuccinia psidii MF-1 TaxID=1389203 RepID=A0A9Q3PBN9_9BASI|nr:hypothetical protein [Austropuccinia psidii MF-1]